MKRVRLGVSGRLLDREVCFDGGHRRSRFLTDEVERHIEWIPLSGDVDAIERSGDGAEPATLLWRRSRGALDVLADSDLDGYVLMRGSPVFASALVAAMPHLPVEEGARLRDPRIGEAFFERVFAGRRLREMLVSDPTPSDLIAFHARHKLQLLSHSPNLMRSLGRVVATASRGLRSALTHYVTAFPQVLAIPSTRGRHVNVLEHASGYLSGVVESSARLDVLEAVRAYARAAVPLVVPVTLVSHSARAEEIGYLERQTYLNPYPSSLRLRNAI